MCLFRSKLVGNEREVGTYASNKQPLNSSLHGGFLLHMTTSPMNCIYVIMFVCKLKEAFFEVMGSVHGR